jgi:XRE family transcriptional regulator, regulator of sulfur utilization
MITRKQITLIVCSTIAITGIIAYAQTAKPVMGSAVFDWNKIEVKATKSGERRQFFQSPTATLDELQCHVTTLNKGETAHAPHQHPEEELIVVKEGTIEVVQGGVTNRVGTGSVIFHSANVMHGMRNAGDGVASYHVFKWASPGMKKRDASK